MQSKYSQMKQAQPGRNTEAHKFVQRGRDTEAHKCVLRGRTHQVEALHVAPCLPHVQITRVGAHARLEELPRRDKIPAVLPHDYGKVLRKHMVRQLQAHG